MPKSSRTFRSFFLPGNSEDTQNELAGRSGEERREF